MPISGQTTICYFPGRESSYARSRVVKKALESAGYKVLDCSSPHKNFKRYVEGFLSFLKFKNHSDIIVVGFLGQFLMLLVRLCAPKRKIVFDALISIYQTLCFDRQVISYKGIFARLGRFLDRTACRLADKVILDTQEHINYFIKEFKLPEDLFERIWVGSDDTIMFPKQGKLSKKEFIVHFHGEFQPLHGASVIVEAARLLPEVTFHLIGKGKDLNRCSELIKKYQLQNVRLMNPVSYEKLSEYMAQADVCLGIFGDTQKTQLVIPHKVYETLAMAKPLITADTPAIRELLTNKEHALLCMNNAESLKEAITLLKNDAPLRERLALNGHKLFQEKCSIRALGVQFKKVITNL